MNEALKQKHNAHKQEGFIMKRTIWNNKVNIYRRYISLIVIKKNNTIFLAKTLMVFCFFLLLLFCTGYHSAVAESNSNDVSSYYIFAEKDDGTLQIEKYIGPNTANNIIIPDIIEGKTITEIGEYAFANQNQLSGKLIIPESVTYIRDYAFFNCSGFTGYLKIPDRMIYIGEHAFENCYGFSGSLIIPSSVSSVAAYAFHNCSGFNGGLVIKNGVKTLGDYAFYNCYGFSGSLIVPDSVVSIGICTFFPCEGFTGRVVCYKKDTDGSFYMRTCIALYCSRNSTASTWANDSSQFVQSELNITAQAGEFSTPEYSYHIIRDGSIRIDRYIGPNNANNIVIPSSIEDKPVTIIGEYAFDSQSSITGTLTIPDTVKQIKCFSFSRCSSLSEIIIGDNVEIIENNAFEWCDSLSSIIIPSSVSMIGDLFLSRCYNLESIIVDHENKFYCSYDGVLFDKTKTTLIYYPTNKKDPIYYLPSAVESIYHGAFMDNACIQHIILPESLKNLGDTAFANCINLKSINLPGSIIEIPIYAFENCSCLSEVTIADGIKKIGDYAFRWCTDLKIIHISEGIPLKSYYHMHNGELYELDLPASIEFVGTAVFDFTSVGRVVNPDLVLPSSMKTIESEAFAGTNVKYICIPESVNTIEERAFAECKNLTFVYFATGNDSTIHIAEDAFNNINDIYFIYDYNYILSEYLFSHNYKYIPRLEEDGNG